ncbi:MAG: pantoate--beta-alanine ligase [Candidatus Eisenbacteria bacterium]
MRTVSTPAAVREAVRRYRAAGESVGFVPTMGALHAGHRSLLARARKANDRVVASIFVNPLQFGPGEDFARYPRPLARDRRALLDEGCDLLYLPRPERLYPAGFATRVSVGGLLSSSLEGEHRPGHFDGVATVVAKLLIAVEPDRLYLGQKDAQQAILLKRMVADLDFGIEVVVCPTVREPDGLALSSRNVYLSAEERQWAPALHRALEEAAEAAGGAQDAALARRAEQALARSLASGPGKLDYARVVDAGTLGEPQAGRPWLIALAYRLGPTRLIDNVIVRPARKSGKPRSSGTISKARAAR